MRQLHETLSFETCGPGLSEITDAVEGALAQSGIREGLLTLVVQHTSASLLVQENADPSARRDLEDFFARIAPPGLPLRPGARPGVGHHPLQGLGNAGAVVVVLVAVGVGVRVPPIVVLDVGVTVFVSVALGVLVLVTVGVDVGDTVAVCVDV